MFAEGLKISRKTFHVNSDDMSCLCKARCSAFNSL